MKQTLNKLLDILFPPRASQLIVRTNLEANLCSQSGCHEGIFYCANYTHPVIHAAIRENKFYNNSQAQTTLANLLTTWTDKKRFADVCFIPIPLGKDRQRERGHNQVLSVLKKTRYSAESVLSRVTETAPQVSLSRQQRLHNITGIFQCDTQLLKKMSSKTFILFDDVVTTGATLNEARATLAPHLPPDTKLICLALAH
jgi:predicted amidophosphoribosyltransferase